MCENSSDVSSAILPSLFSHAEWLKFLLQLYMELNGQVQVRGRSLFIAGGGGGGTEEKRVG